MVEAEFQGPIVEVLRQLSTNVVLGALLVVVVSGISAFCGAYLKKRGEDRALKESFDAIRDQLRTTTRDSEEIKQYLSGQAWRSQRQWSAREQYYSALLTHLHQFRLALQHLSEYFLEPGSEHTSDSQRGDHFQRLLNQAASSYAEVEKLQGPASIFLSKSAVESLEKLLAEHWNLSSFGALCTADYVNSAQEIAKAGYLQVLAEAKAELGVDTTL